MIEARSTFDAVARALTAKARRLAEARAISRRAGPHRWRRSSLLWPLFGKD